MGQRIKVTLTFEIEPGPLDEWEASTVEEAARNLEEWYEDGSASVIEDAASSANLTVRIDVVPAGA